uniref:Uncharacterized protein LOC102808657 n=1 Tax=Saccoglossus kowalevskii TaxID=10224 RepID=A0ABM0LXN3_SACKO|nr:PREDICTED: uncharacterized protein LOC102808657 [Saccoglossus kowalevskii]
MISGHGNSECIEIPFTVYDIQEFTESNSFANSFLNGISLNLPDWISITDKEHVYIKFSGIRSMVLHGSEISRYGVCRRAPVFDDDLYSVFQFKSKTHISVLGEAIQFPPSVSGMCLLVDVCDTVLGTNILMFPEDLWDKISQFDFLKPLSDKGWVINLIGIGMSVDKKLKFETTSIELWNGDHMFTYTLSSGYNVWMSLSISNDNLLGDSDTIGFSLSGDLVFMLVVDDIDKMLTHIFASRWEAIVTFTTEVDMHITFKLVVDGARIVLDLAELALDLVIVTLEEVKFALETANSALELVKDVVAVGIDVLNFIIRHGLNAIVDIQRIWFEIEVSTADLFVFEVAMDIDLFRAGMRTVKVTINFRNLAESIWKVAVSVIENLSDILIPLKKKRSIEYADRADTYSNSSAHTNQTLHIETFESEYVKYMNASGVSNENENGLRLFLFKKNCNTFLNIYDFLFQAMSLLNEVAYDSKKSRENASEGLNDLIMLRDNITFMDVDLSEVNITEAYVNYNITEEDIELEISKVNMSESPAIREAFAVLNTSHLSSLKSLELAAEYQIVGPWKAAMENITSEIFTKEECVSFEDCLLVTFDKFYSLYEDVDFLDVDAMRNLIMKSKTQFYRILRNDSLRLDDALEISSGFLDVLEETVTLKIFCAEPPLILNELVNTTISENEEIVLFCNAIGDPAPTITWYKDGTLISKDMKLLLGNATLSTIGWYKCAASNHVINVTSDEIFIDVLTPPTVTNFLQDETVIAGQEPPFQIMCNVTGRPTPDVTWYYSIDSQTFTIFSSGGTHLLFDDIHTVKMGWYRCEASNSIGRYVSNTMSVKVLKTSLAIATAELNFQFYQSTIAVNKPEVHHDSLSNLERKFSAAIAYILGQTELLLTVSVLNATIDDGLIYGHVHLIIKGANSSRMNDLNMVHSELQSIFEERVENVERFVNALEYASYEDKYLFTIDDIPINMKSVDCESGFYQHSSDAPFKCLPCPTGSYQPGIGSATCLPCPDGYTTYKDSALRIDECNVSLVSDMTTPSQTTIVAIELNNPGSSGDILSVLDITAVCCSVIILLVIGIVIYYVANRRNKRGIYRPTDKRGVSVEMDGTNDDPTSQNNFYDNSFGIDALATEM